MTPADVRSLPLWDEAWAISWTAMGWRDPETGKLVYLASCVVSGGRSGGIVVGTVSSLEFPDATMAIKLLQTAMLTPMDSHCETTLVRRPSRRPSFVLVAHRWGAEAYTEIMKFVRSCGVPEIRYESRQEAEKSAGKYEMDPDGLNYKSSRRERRCANCGEIEVSKRQMSKCGRCNLVYYCGTACSRLHWKTHKPECRVTDLELLPASAELATEHGTPTTPQWDLHETVDSRQDHQL